MGYVLNDVQRFLGSYIVIKQLIETLLAAKPHGGNFLAAH